MSQRPSPKAKCLLFLPMAFNYSSKHPLTKLIHSPHKIQFHPQSTNPICHQFKSEPKKNKFLDAKFHERKTPAKSKHQKWSISRMLEKAKPEFNTISFISKLYKKPGEKEVVIRRSKEKSEESESLFKNTLYYKSIKLKTKANERYARTAEKTEKRYSKTINIRTLNSTRQEPRLRLTSREGNKILFRKKSPQQNTESWTIEEWSHQNQF